jgi:microcystin-dependent protein
MEGTMAVITTWAADFAPKSWAYCNGQLLSIAQNTALFSLLGTTYGGDGRVTFGLPNLQSRTVVSPGQGLSAYTLGEVGGSPTVTLTINNIPPHNHNGAVNIALRCNNTDGATGEPGGNYPGVLANGYTAAPDAAAATPTYTGVIGIAGSSQPYSTQAPYLVLNYIICMYGIFPSRN